MHFDPEVRLKTKEHFTVVCDYTCTLLNLVFIVPSLAMQSPHPVAAFNKQNNPSKTNDIGASVVTSAIIMAATIPVAARNV